MGFACDCRAKAFCTKGRSGRKGLVCRNTEYQAVWHKSCRPIRKMLGTHGPKAMSRMVNLQLDKKWRGFYLIFVVALVLSVSRCAMSVMRMLPTAETLNRERQTSGMRLMLGEGQKLVTSSLQERRYSPATQILNFSQDSNHPNEETLTCDRSSQRTDVCILKGDIRTYASSSTLYLVSHQVTGSNPEDHKIRPYTRKWENTTMASVDELSLTQISPTDAPECQVRHSVPAVVFSTGGYTGNLFHDFTDVIVPLFITSAHFRGQTVFVVLNHKQWWTNKFADIIKQLSSYDILDFSQDTRVHCFPEAIVGLRFHADLRIDPATSPNGHTIADFQKLLTKSFAGKKRRGFLSGLFKKSSTGHMAENKNESKPIEKPKPKMVLIARKGSRVFMNQREIVEAAKKFGFSVTVLSPDRSTDLSEMFRIVHNCDVFMGVHGAALTHFLFLRPGAVFIQVVPLGIEWASRTFFREPAMKMNIHYLEYQILPEESSLYEEYPKDHPFLRNPKSVNGQGWEATKKVYLDAQNVRMGLPRLKKLLAKALELIQPKNHFV